MRPSRWREASSVFFKQSSTFCLSPIRNHYQRRNQECLVGDQLRVNQVFINVIANAVKFTPRGGKVTMKLSEKQTSPEHIHLRCIISDNGIGMKKDFLSRVFLPFEQETAEIAQHFGGTGLGLPLPITWSI